MSAREIFPVRFAGSRPGGGTQWQTDPARNEELDDSPKVSPAPGYAGFSPFEGEEQELNPVQGMRNSPVQDLPKPHKHVGENPNAKYGEPEVPTTAGEMRTDTPTPTTEPPTALESELSEREALAPTDAANLPGAIEVAALEPEPAPVIKKTPPKKSTPRPQVNRASAEREPEDESPVF